MKQREQPDDDLGHALDAWRDIEPSASLLRRVAQVPVEHPGMRAARPSFWQQFKPFGLSLAAGAVGVCVGLIQAPESSQLSSGGSKVAGDVPQASETEPDMEWEQLAQLAAGEEWPEGWDE